MFPEGYVYAGDSRADFPVWQGAKAAILVAASRSLGDAVQAAGIPIERVFDDRPPRLAAWIKALRPHQWAKNLVVLVPLALGWRDVSLSALATALAMMVLLSIAASLTYLVNDMADLSSDRKHWSKRRRAFASGAIGIRSGLMIVGFASGRLRRCGGDGASGRSVFLRVAGLPFDGSASRYSTLSSSVCCLQFASSSALPHNLIPSACYNVFRVLFACVCQAPYILRAAQHGSKKIEGRLSGC